VIIGDIHEDGRCLYPGTGSSAETGKDKAMGTKLNIPLTPRSSDESFVKSFDKVLDFVRTFNPGFIFLQCVADGLAGDLITIFSIHTKLMSTPLKNCTSYRTKYARAEFSPWEEAGTTLQT
jgi:acetoin utilization deacetylase AcuC-like enzyme